ncbi:hypothetical protein JTE90_014459 [Oedothorax gibbosus]|uniref:Uncharacterized protein n=1 Tax=Oedothorax gibbosus TaxID=931172 RepID=A0AAV6VKM4_9ARAC|nr:hypothetical protein JTE90_014459 [Oedothorax gibbosus]
MEQFILKEEKRQNPKVEGNHGNWIKEPSNGGSRSQGAKQRGIGNGKGRCEKGVTSLPLVLSTEIIHKRGIEIMEYPVLPELPKIKEAEISDSNSDKGYANFIQRYDEEYNMLEGQFNWQLKLSSILQVNSLPLPQLPLIEMAKDFENYILKVSEELHLLNVKLHGKSKCPLPFTRSFNYVPQMEVEEMEVDEIESEETDRKPIELGKIQPEVMEIEEIEAEKMEQKVTKSEEMELTDTKSGEIERLVKDLERMKLEEIEPEAMDIDE